VLLCVALRQCRPDRPVAFEHRGKFEPAIVRAGDLLPCYRRLLKSYPSALQRRQSERRFERPYAGLRYGFSIRADYDAADSSRWCSLQADVVAEKIDSVNRDGRGLLRVDGGWIVSGDDSLSILGRR